MAYPIVYDQLVKRGVIDAKTPFMTRIDNPDIAGLHVWGRLPMSRAWMVESFTRVSVAMPDRKPFTPEATEEDLDQARIYLQTYKVKSVSRATLLP